jgi:hypothetical protein
MQTRTSHAPIVRVLTAAGAHVYSRSEKPKIVVASDSAGRASVILEVDEEQWMEERRRSLARIRERKQARRLGVSVSISRRSNSGQETEIGLAGSVVPNRRHAGLMTRTDSIAEEEEECDVRSMRPTGSPLRGSTDVGDSSDSAEDDTDHSSVDTRTLAGSDTGSEIGEVGHSSKPVAVEFVHNLSSPITLLV